MKAIILAAGRGSRLGALTMDRPKCLQEVGGRTLLDHQITALRVSGIDDIVIVTGYRSRDLTGIPGIRTRHNDGWETSNMVESLRCAAAEITEPVIVSYADIIYGSDAVRALTARGDDLVVSYDTAWRELWTARFPDPRTDVESFRIDEDGRIRDIGQRVERLDEVQGQYIGLTRISPIGWAWMTTVMQRDPWEVAVRLDMTTLLRRCIVAGYPVYGEPLTGGWCEVDTPTDLALANRRWANRFPTI